MFRARSICRRASGTRLPVSTKDRTAVIYCYSQTCKLAAAAAVEFASAGIPVVEMEGGFEAWEKNQLPVENKASRLRRPQDTGDKPWTQFVIRIAPGQACCAFRLGLHSDCQQGSSARRELACRLCASEVG